MRIKTMNANEINYIEPNSPVTYLKLPSPTQMERYHARIRRERSQYLAQSLVAFARKLGQVATGIRRIAAACTAARLHLRNA
jgi:hypothetical protein